MAKKKKNKPSKRKQGSHRKQGSPKSRAKQKVQEGPLAKPKWSSFERVAPWFMALFGFVLYANTLGHLYAIDDNLVIYGHEYVEKGLKGTPGIFTTPFTYGTSKLNDNGYRPITLLVFALEIELFGKNAFFPQHLIHVLFYVLSCFFLFLLLRRMFWKFHYLFALLVSMLYIAHPIHTEVVANLKSLDEILGFLFGFVLTTLMLFRLIDTKKTLYLVLTYVFFAIGIFSKENVITYLVIIPLTLFMFSELNFKRIVRLCWPLVAIVGVFLVIRQTILGQYPLPEYDMMQNILMGAKSQWDRYSTAMLVMMRYIGLLFFPHPLAWDYSYNQIPLTNVQDIRVWISVAIHVSMLVFALYKIRSKNIFAYGILYYLTVMSVNSNLFIMTNCTLGERFLYSPSLGFSIIIVAGLFAVFQIKTVPKHKKVQYQIAFFTVMVLGAYSLKTVDRNADWYDSFRLSEVDIKSNPNSIRVISTLAAVYLATAKRKDTSPADRKMLYRKIIPLARRILKLFPGHKEATYNIGICYYFLGKYDKAEKAFLAHLKQHPSDVKAYNNLGGLYYFRKDYRTALKYFHKFVDAKKAAYAKAKKPKKKKEILDELKKAINNLGVVTLDNRKQPDEALPYFQEARNLDPKYADPVKKTGDYWVAKGKIFKAIEFYRKAAKLDPKKYGNVGPLIQRAFRRHRGHRRRRFGRGTRPPGFQWNRGNSSRFGIPGRGKLPAGLRTRGLKNLPAGLRRKLLQLRKQTAPSPQRNPSNVSMPPPRTR